MAEQVIWSLEAQTDRKKILNYWVTRNKSTTYSKKLNYLFQETVKLIAKFPQIGRKTDIENVRAKLVKDYYLFYRDQGEDIIILSIWDCRQDPKKLKWKI